MRNRRVRGCAELVQVGETLLGACYSVRVMIENQRAYCYCCAFALKYDECDVIRSLKLILINVSYDYLALI
jgi:hypothetical protein